jgi:hypothetical protein
MKKQSLIFLIALILMYTICKGTATPIAYAIEEKPMPADTYYSWYSPQIANNILQYIINEEYHPHVDFNGDGILTLSDAVSVYQRYNYNVKYGNTITLDENYINRVAEENGLNIIYWEIYKINNDACREYEYTANDITTVYVWYEEEEKGDSLIIELNPFEEKMQVMN